MLRSFSETLGRVALVIAGAGFGLVEVLRATTADPGAGSRLYAAEAKLAEMELILDTLTTKAVGVEERLEKTVNRHELTELVDQTLARLASEVDSRLEQQTRAIEALRTMVLQTDELLQKVLDGLERHEAEAD